MSEALRHAGIGHTGSTKDPDGTAAQEGFLVKLNRDGKIDVDALDTAAILATGFRADEFQPSNVTAPAAASVLTVGAQMVGQTPGGGTGVEGIITAAPNNVVLLMDENNDEYFDGTENKVYGRVTVDEISLTGSITISNGSAAVSGVGTAFLSEVDPGDLIQLDADGIYAVVLSVTDDSNLTLTAVYGGTGGSGAGSRRRWELTFYSNIASVETLYSGWAGTETLQWFVLKVYNLSNIPVVSGRRTVPSDQVVGDIPLATETLAGKVVLAADGDTASSEAVQGDDSRLAVAARMTAVRNVASDTALAITDRFLFFTGNADIDLLPIGTAPGQDYYFKNVGSHTASLTPDGAETIDGVAGALALGPYEAFTLVDNGTEWSIL